MKHNVIKIELVYKKQPTQHIKAKDIANIISPDVDDLIQYKKQVAAITDAKPDRIDLTFETNEPYNPNPIP